MPCGLFLYLRSRRGRPYHRGGAHSASGRLRIRRGQLSGSGRLRNGHLRDRLRRGREPFANHLRRAVPARRLHVVVAAGDGRGVQLVTRQRFSSLQGTPYDSMLEVVRCSSRCSRSLLLRHQSTPWRCSRPRKPRSLLPSGRCRSAERREALACLANAHHGSDSRSTTAASWASKRPGASRRLRLTPSSRNEVGWSFTRGRTARVTAGFGAGRSDRGGAPILA